MSLLVETKNLTKHFDVTKGFILKRRVGVVHAVDNVNLKIKKGQTRALVGESGCGKTTLGKCILRIIEPTSGRVLFEGKDITKVDKGGFKALRRQMQMIFQNPYSSVNPRMSVKQIIKEPLEIHGEYKNGRDDRIIELLTLVGLKPEDMNKYPHELSGGMRQRVVIARALALNPKFIVADEPVASIDVSVRAQILNLIMDLQRKLKLTYLYISHDLSTVRNIADEVSVMYLGEIVEEAPTEELFNNPSHPYTKALLSAIPIPDPTKRTKRYLLSGEVPGSISPPSGCRFHTRCPYAANKCSEKTPPLTQVKNDHFVACYYPL
jgi:oligopeptide transport system ATP-binding protein